MHTTLIKSVNLWKSCIDLCQKELSIATGHSEVWKTKIFVVIIIYQHFHCDKAKPEHYVRITNGTFVNSHGTKKARVKTVNLAVFSYCNDLRGWWSKEEDFRMLIYEGTLYQIAGKVLM